MFRPLHREAEAPTRGAFHADARFGAKPGAPAATHRDDPLAVAWDEGFRAGAAQAREAAAQDSLAATTIELAFTRLAETDAETLAEKLRETVIALCGAAIDTAAVDPQALSRRIDAALALLRRSSDERVLRLHPEDLALIAGRLPPGIEAHANAALERGALRVETAGGGVEDGPAQWRAAIAAAVHAC